VFANRFLNSDEVHDRRYLVWTKQELSTQHLKHLSSGVLLDDGPTLPAIVKHVKRNCYEFILTEGRNRQIRRMIELCGTYVIRLKRIQFGDYSLDDLSEGGYAFISLVDIFNQRLLV